MLIQISLLLGGRHFHRHPHHSVSQNGVGPLLDTSPRLWAPPRLLHRVRVRVRNRVRVRVRTIF